MKHTWAKEGGHPDFPLIRGPFSPEKGYAYIDRMNFRLPDSVQPQGGLGLHLDTNPWDKHQALESKWRPVQCSIALTDHLDWCSGGLEVVKGFHREINSYFDERKAFKDNSKGLFYRLNKSQHASLHKRITTVVAPKGSIVLWDNRIPHKTADKLDGSDTREVVFATFLPDVKINREYAQNQKKCFLANVFPPDFDRKKKGQVDYADRDRTLKLDSFEKKLMGLEEWSE